MSGTVEITVRNGKTFLIDADDEALVRSISWRIQPNTSKGNPNWYVRGYGPEDPETGVRRHIFLHRFLLNAPKDALVDHINAENMRMMATMLIGNSGVLQIEEPKEFPLALPEQSLIDRPST